MSYIVSTYGFPSTDKPLQPIPMVFSRQSLLTGRDMATIYRWTSSLARAAQCCVMTIHYAEDTWSVLSTHDHGFVELDSEACFESIKSALPELSETKPIYFGLKPIIIPTATNASQSFLGQLPRWGLQFVCIGDFQDPARLRLLSSLAEICWQNVCQHEELCISKPQKQAFVKQIAQDFEELYWLRLVSQQMGGANFKQNIFDMALVQLPHFQRIVEAELVAMIPADAFDQLAKGELSKFPSSGKSPVSTERLFRFAERCNQESKGLTSVFNIQTTPEVLEGYPEIRNCIFARLERHSKVFGFLIAINKQVGMLSQSPEEFLLTDPNGFQFGTFEAGLVTNLVTILSSHAANSELFREQQQLLTGIVRAVINAIDAKDPYTCGHSDRVAEFSRSIAEQLGFDPRESDRVYLAGLLHDVGKIGIPDSILSKPEELTEEEHNIVKKHPEIGYSILKHLKPIEYVLPGVLHHHEALNGTGYPHGLVGEQIPLMGRIIAVADAYDAMTSDRPYRKGMPSEKAETILRKEAGSTWDELVVFALLECIQKGIVGPQSSHQIPLENTDASASSVVRKSRDTSEVRFTVEAW